MAHAPSKSKPISYADAVRTFNDQEVQDDINDACSKLAQAMNAMMAKFDSIAKQMHTIDLLRANPPLKPRWDSMRKDLADLLWQFRTNSTMISGRLKLLPLAARNVDRRSGRSPHQAESLQVLQTYMSISAEQAALSRSLVERVFRLSAQIIAFLTEFTRLATHRATSGRKEMSDLAQRLSELETQMQQLFQTSYEVTADATHLAFTSSRLVASSGRPAGRSKVTRRPVVLDGDLANIGRAYEHTDCKRNEVAHAQYAAQLRQDRTDPLAAAHAMLCAFLLDELLTSESGLSLFLSIWSRLHRDCNDVYQWITNPTQTATPAAISCFMEQRCNLYTPFAGGLDFYAAGVDPALCASEHRDSR
ncbi:hypothetical protein NLJ89_g1653 [Agrocybe chaxingu]|uniref:Uncharacterized protein n=1 Tax=Agrocybe chaxingu TaxID=84603 RepID=A0A9W8TE09_9AGAR|nr:hypothetical protein NLJ89_g1653 [Agrocybe chaxingu]